MNTLSPREFFEHYLPQAWAHFSEPDAEGTLAFGIADAGEWTIDFKARNVVPGFNAKADFSLRMSAQDFSAMVNDTFDANAAVAEKRVQAQGDARLLAAFSLLIAPLAQEPEEESPV